MTAVVDHSTKAATDLSGDGHDLLRQTRLAWLHGRKGQLLSLAVAMTTLVTSVGVGTSSSLALFGDTTDAAGAELGTKAIFPGERVTPAFDVKDASAGAAPVDRSSPLAFSGDGLTLTSSDWSSAFSPSHYLDFDLNASLPDGLATSGTDVELRLASAGAGSTTCYYVELRRISTGALLDTYGSAGSPLDCVTGTSPILSTTAIDATITSTDDLNDLRIRVLGADSGATGTILDRATVSGSTALSTFTLYPVRLTDAADGTPISTVWELAGP